ncbi:MULTISPECIES: LytTR family DNA-binding domain-containing protein [unclassified Sphingobacterium]|uniref:LytR/AlgR family response regulator transcription factor n=1 Tax=unclassified Sphingobacterium TaxID=2609468 RepID=UPI0010CFA2D9|nr:MULTISPECIES: LytTR family DNA-binding domain-containing protein [unclassified Sphingobacterium]MCS3557532.1 two-component system LytT family response regulator [Sphingobacterium sp. JUb21]TCQ95917.1 LytTR family two component transcriptional regulator [Sphingobacterium sp. JUb20]
MIKVYVLEDEKIILRHLLQILNEMPDIKVLGYTEGIAEAKVEIPLLKPDVILADIRLKDGNSFQLFDEIGTENFQIVFLTAYDQYAIEALNLGALGYLLKPVNKESLHDMLDKCRQHRGQMTMDPERVTLAKDHYLSPETPLNRRIALKSQEYIEIVSMDDILYCKSDKSYTSFFLTDKREVLVSKGLKLYENMLARCGFLRCHQSYLVNFLYVKKYYREGFLEMTNKEMIPVSIRKKEEVLFYLENLA